MICLTTKIVKRKSTSDDPVTEYAKRVVAKKVIAGPYVRDACKRHLDDLKHGHERGLIFDVQLVHRAIGFFSDVLKLSGGGYEGLPFDLNNPGLRQIF